MNKKYDFLNVSTVGFKPKNKETLKQFIKELSDIFDTITYHECSAKKDSNKIIINIVDNLNFCQEKIIRITNQGVFYEVGQDYCEIFFDKNDYLKFLKKN